MEEEKKLAEARAAWDAAEVAAEEAWDAAVAAPESAQRQAMEVADAKTRLATEAYQQHHKALLALGQKLAEARSAAMRGQAPRLA